MKGWARPPLTAFAVRLAPMEADFYILGRYFEAPGGLFSTHSFYVAQHKNRPVLIGQEKHRAFPSTYGEFPV